MPWAHLLFLVLTDLHVLGSPRCPSCWDGAVLALPGPSLPCTLTSTASLPRWPSSSSCLSVSPLPRDSWWVLRANTFIIHHYKKPEPVPWALCPCSVSFLSSLYSKATGHSGLYLPFVLIPVLPVFSLTCMAGPLSSLWCLVASIVLKPMSISVRLTRCHI